MEIRPREIVIFATDYPALVAWYRDALGFTVRREFTEGFHYANLETESGLRVGITPAAEVGVTPGDRANNTVVPQIEVDDVRDLLAHVEKAGGTVRFGPSFDEESKFWYGAFADPEGNPIWVVDANCP